MNSVKIDTITNLPNIYAFIDVMNEQLLNHHYNAVITISLNRFQRINSIYSYEFGNRVLREFALRLNNLMQQVGTVYRMDGTKFAVCLYNSDRAMVEDIYKQIQQLANTKLIIDSIPVTLTISAGAVLLDNFSGDAQHVLTAVTYALTESKRVHHGDLIFFEYTLEEETLEQIATMNTITKCICNNCKGFHLLYQPIIKPETGEISGAEALLRWRDDACGEVSPGVFIPWIEDNPCFLDLGEWLLRQAMTDTKAILQIKPDFVLSVNIAYSQLERKNFREIVKNLLTELDFPAQNLCMELTENCCNIDMNYLKQEAAFFKSLGISLALDDFGTGYSALNLLFELPINHLKIDTSFVCDVIENQPKQILIDTMIHCAHRLGVDVCVEGIETEEIRQFLKPYQVKFHQGFYYSRPIEHNILINLIKQNPVYEKI